jgi:hypothetical protein
MTNRLPAIYLNPARSRQLVIWYRCIYVLTFVVVISAPIGLTVKISLLTLVLLTRLPIYKKFTPQQVVRAKIKSSGWSRIVLIDGMKRSARLRADSLVTPWLILLRFDLRGRWRHPVMVLFQDALPEREMRSLRIFLKYGSFVSK